MREFLLRVLQVPFHMHINLELLECVYLTSAMLLEIPYMAGESRTQARTHSRVHTMSRIHACGTGHAGARHAPTDARCYVLKPVRVVTSSLMHISRRALALCHVFVTFAAHAFDYRRRIISKSFHYQLRQSDKQTLVGELGCGYWLDQQLFVCTAISLGGIQMWTKLALLARTSGKHARARSGSVQGDEDRQLEKVS